MPLADRGLAVAHRPVDDDAVAEPVEARPASFSAWARVMVMSGALVPLLVPDVS